MRKLTVSDYADRISLHRPYVPTLLQRLTNTALVLRVLQELTPVLQKSGIKDVRELGSDKQRTLLDSAITVLPPGYLSENGKSALDTLLYAERQSQSITDVSELAPFLKIGDTKVVLWRGDITTLKADAIVNAANSQLLGCFLPQHKCIDNAIHNRAGVQLREDCDVIIQLQGGEEPTGEAKITRGYNLPAKYVIHTVGPIVQGSVTKESEQLLAASYQHILDITQEVEDARSVAFCAISTGVFGYPIEQATPVAIHTVANWLKDNPSKLDTVVFNVFSEQDYDVYQSELEEFVCKN
ncbi:protein-ADP-ribose hydrolase [Grimontia sp. SpTr1]|uniref:protein-ADP-ribose hydrolase n=1 Tax=Grimontia sp. SpTr1 TaxID=2995319 RepID=UPI00248C7436|nr:protein-ADP-ribose hydrolase [Grimontia sp. SpTr1]